LAFTLPIIARLMASPRSSKKVTIRALVVGPTRELVMQSDEVIRNACAFSKNAIKCAIAYGGAARSVQQKAIQAGCDVLSATPGRLMDFMESGDVS
jgi:superfamily II DNA/RNA helicase